MLKEGYLIKEADGARSPVFCTCWSDVVSFLDTVQEPAEAAAIGVNIEYCPKYEPDGLTEEQEDYINRFKKWAEQHNNIIKNGGE